MKSTLWRALALVVILSMMVPVAAVAQSAAPDSDQPAAPEGDQPATPVVAQPAAESPEENGPPAPDPMAKLDSGLREAAANGGDEPVEAYVLVEAGTDLSRMGDVVETRPFPPDLELVVLDIRPGRLTKLASTPSVLSAEMPAAAVEAASASIQGGEGYNLFLEPFCRTPMPPENWKFEWPGPDHDGDASATNSLASAMDWYGISLIEAPEAWAKGYKGDDVNIAVLDSGVDFGHPDLEDNVAFYDGGPYDGWPIALDSRSMRGYPEWSSWDNYDDDPHWGKHWIAPPYDWREESWYAYVEDVIDCTAGVTATFKICSYDFETESTLEECFKWTIGPEITALSQSGQIRWGVHPDVDLARNFWHTNHPIPFILVDTGEELVYDMVIADLNHDHWFDSYDDTAVLGTDDPVLNQDLGSYVYTDTQVLTGTLYVPGGFGEPPTWYGPMLGPHWEIATEVMTLTYGAWIYAPNHDSPEDCPTKDEVGPGEPFCSGADGIEDVSGGMVYFIADGERAIPGMDYLYPSYEPIPNNGQWVAFMLDTFWSGAPSGTAAASAAVSAGKISGYVGAMTEFSQYKALDPQMNFADISDALPWLKGKGVGTVQGPAPEAGVIAIGPLFSYDQIDGDFPDNVDNDCSPDMAIYDALTFLAYGVDGQPNSGDEFVDVVDMSFTFGTEYNDGWDWRSRMVSYYNQNFLPDTTFVVAAGDEGYGYGTVESPQSGNSVVTVGSSTLYGTTDAFGGALDEAQINDGEVASRSSRGPGALGRPDPDVVATGDCSTADLPLNLAPVLWENLYFGEVDGIPALESGETDAELTPDHLFGYMPPFPVDGNNAWLQWGGTHRAAAEAAGVVALIYQAYEQANGAFPDHETAREILMSSADDLNHDVLMQGAGRVNADQATDVAGGEGSIYVSPSVLQAGEYHGTQYEAFGNVLFPGDTWSQTFTVYNTGDDDKTVALDDEILTRMEVLTYTQVVTPYMGWEDECEVHKECPWCQEYLVCDPYFFYAHYFVLTDPSKTVITSTVLPTHAIHGPDLAVPVPDGADLMQVQMVVPFEVFDIPSNSYCEQDTEGYCGKRGGYVDPNPDTIRKTTERWSLTVYDWTDRNGDDKLWEDNNADGIVNPLPYREVFPPLDLAQAQPQNVHEPLDHVDVSVLCNTEIVDATAPLQNGVCVTETEINRFGTSELYGNSQEVTVRLGDRDDIDNIILGIVHLEDDVYRHKLPEGYDDGGVATQLVDENTAKFYQDNPLLIKVVFYQKADWDLVEEAPTSLEVDAGESETFEATFTIPADQPPGVYEGAITADDGDHISLIPTTVNVAVPSDELLFELGGTPRALTPYDNGRGFGAWDWSRYLDNDGDWRFFYYDANAGFAQQYLYIHNEWGDLCCNMPTLFTTYAWGPNTGDPYSKMEPDKFGPYSLQDALLYYDDSDDLDSYHYSYYGGWLRDADGTPQPESRTVATLWDGLNQVQFRNEFLSGKHVCGEPFEANAGVFGVDAPGEDSGGLVINTDQDSGSFELPVVSPMDSMWTWVEDYEVYDQQIFRNQDVPLGKHTEEVPADLLDGWVYTFTVPEGVQLIKAKTRGPKYTESDIDLYLLYDFNGDGLFNIYDPRELRDYAYTGSSDEWVSQEEPLPGTWAVVMYGYHVFPGDQFDLYLYVFGGADFMSIAETEDYVYDWGGHIYTDPGVPRTLNVNWHVPGPGVWYAELWFSLPEEYDVNDDQPPYISVPVWINKEGVMLDVEKEVDPNDLWVHWGDILTYTVTVEQIGSETVLVNLNDILPEGLDFIGDQVEDKGDHHGWSQPATINGMTSTLAAEIPGLFCYGEDRTETLGEDRECCNMWYNEWKRTVNYECRLPIEDNGKFYTKDEITFWVRVEAQPGTCWTNKADISWALGWQPGEMKEIYFSGLASALSPESCVPYGYYLPIIYGPFSNFAPSKRP
jgi:uncharacterized repeat protein (TIGR01451 family)